MIEKQHVSDSSLIKTSSNKKNWTKKLLVGGFLFFLIKGLIWLAIFFGLGASFL